jgi:hypothetical protein
MATKEDTKATIRLGADAVSTIVAALRLFQKTYRYRDDEALSGDFPEIFAADRLRFGTVVDPAPLRGDDIDSLCEQLNCLDELELKATVKPGLRMERQ